MDPFVAEIRIFPFNFAPKGWAFCDGQLLPLSQNTALFSLVGTYYGGDGKSNFALPDLQGRAAMHQGQGSGLSPHYLGESSGVETVALLTSEIPVHTHTLEANPNQSDNLVPSPTTSIGASTGGKLFVTSTPAAPPLSPMAVQALAPAGGSLPHSNLQPYLTLSFCIALQGVYPPRG